MSAPLFIVSIEHCLAQALGRGLSAPRRIRKKMRRVTTRRRTNRTLRTGKEFTCQRRRAEMKMSRESTNRREETLWRPIGQSFSDQVSYCIQPGDLSKSRARMFTTLIRCAITYFKVHFSCLHLHLGLVA